MKRNILLVTFISIIILAAGILFTLKFSENSAGRKIAASYSGSESCIPCHQKFYDLWADSKHGLAMQPVTPGILKSLTAGNSERIRVGNGFFAVSLENDSLIYTEWEPGGAVNQYTAEHLMGGKYVFYFLTTIDKGKLQILPLAYDIGNNSWYNNPESGVRHFETAEDSPLDWKSHLYTFNTTCYGCHVSQVETNFNLESLSYNTSWREPGINCETCHGPSAGHIKASVRAGEGKTPADLKIVVTSGFTPEQHNSSCGSCHGKGSPIAGRYEPGGRYYDYFNLSLHSKIPISTLMAGTLGRIIQ
ncbi:MAG: multiheme c-type cytochrome [Bacteroidales bacterium]